MTNDDAFMADIIENPDADGPRLIYADWLDDHGHAERAEFIRVQLELAKPAEENGLRPDSRRAELEARERELLAMHGEEWIGRIGDWVTGWRFRRGMLAICIKAELLWQYLQGRERTFGSGGGWSWKWKFEMPLPTSTPYASQGTSPGGRLSAFGAIRLATCMSRPLQLHRTLLGLLFWI